VIVGELLRVSRLWLQRGQGPVEVTQLLDQADPHCPRARQTELPRDAIREVRDEARELDEWSALEGSDMYLTSRDSVPPVLS
jgi:hypothetical protein